MEDAEQSEGINADSSYLVSQEDLVVHYTVRLVKGDKGGSMWLVVNDQYMYHKNDMSIDGHQVYWECARRKQTR